MKEDIDIYQHMVEEIEDYAIVFLDVKGNIRNWNKGANKIQGYRADEAIGQNFRMLFTVQDQAAGLPEQMIKQAINTGKVSKEGWQVRQDGTLFWGSIVITSVYGNGRILKGFSEIVKDLTEKRQAEEKLLQSNELLQNKVAAQTNELSQAHASYQHMFVSNPLPMWIIDIDTFRFLDVNDVALHTYGYTKDEFLAMTAIDIRPEGERYIFTDTDHPQEITAGNTFRGIWQHKKKDGTIIEVEVYAHNIVFDNKVARLILSYDVTEKRAAEKKLASRVKYFKALIENNNDCISLQDEQGNVMYQSPSIERITGYSIEDVRDGSAFDFLHPDDVNDVRKRIDISLQSPGRSVWGINRLKHKDGYYIWTEGTITNLLADENVSALVNNFRDITERKLAGESLSRSKREVEKVYREQMVLSERMSSILNALPANIALINNKGIIIEVNESWKRFADENGFIGQSYGIGDDYIYIAEHATGCEENDGMLIAKAIKSILSGQLKDFSIEYRCDAPARKRWFRCLITRENSSPDTGLVLMHIDVSERRAAEDKVLRQKAQLQNLLKGMGDAFVTLDASWRYTFVNEHALELMGKTRERLLGRNMWEVFPDTVNSVFYREYSEVMATKKDTSFEVYYPSYNMWMDVRAYPHEDGIAIFYNNISERKAAEESLRDSEHKFRALIENSSDMLVLYDKELKLTYCSPSLEKNVGVALGQIVGTSIYDNIFIDDEEIAREAIQQTLDNPGTAVPFLLRKQYGPDKNVYLEGTLTNLLYDSAVNAIVCNYRDITDRKLAEQKVQESYRDIERLLLHTDEAFIMLDNHLKVVSFNRNAETHSQIYFRRTITSGMSILEFADPARIGLLKGIYDQVLAGNSQETEIYVDLENGEREYIQNLLRPIYNAAGLIDGVFVTVRNITVRVKAQMQIEFDQNNLAALINNTNDLMWSLDTHRKLLTSNTAFNDMIRYMTGNDVVKGDDIPAGFSEEQLQLWTKLYAKAFAGEAFTHTQYTEGYDIWAEISFYPIYNGAEVIGLACYSRDITERKLAEKKILNANRLYAFISQINQTIVHSSDEAQVFKEACRIAVAHGKFMMAWIGILDRKNRTLNLVEQYNMHPDDVVLFMDAPYIKSGPTDIVLETDAYYVSNDIENEAGITHWRPFADARGIKSTMMLPIRKNGVIIGTFNLYASETNLFDEDEIRLLQEVAGDISFALDVFEKEKLHSMANERSRLNEFRLNEAQEIAHVGNWEIDLVTGEHSWSQEAQRIIGYISNSNQPVFDTYLSSIHPEDKVSVMKMMSEARSSFHNSFFYHRIIRPDGDIRYIYSESKFEFNENNQPVRLHGIIHDITHAKLAEDSLAQSEENLRLIMDLIPQSIYARNVDGNFIFVNRSFAKLYGCSPNQLISRAITQSEMSQEINDFLPEQDNAVIMGGDTVDVPEVDCIDHEGVNRTFHILKVPYTLAGTNEKAVLGVAQDITESKQAEMERTRMIADIVQRNKDLEQFSYIISHNLRAPVANISGISDILGFEGLGEEEKADLMMELSKSVLKLDAVIKDLNYILQVKQEYSENRENVLFASLLDDIKQSIKNLIKNENVHIVSDFSEAEGILTLKSYLYSIFYNLISNSIKYRQQGTPPVISISSSRQGNHVTLAFTDNGLGIDLGKRGGQVFGLYKRFHTHTEGKGIGLYMVKTQVETLGGRISIESEVNIGTKFIIDFEIN